MKKLLIVVDFQNDFIDGSLGFLDARKLIDKIHDKIALYLDNGDDVIFTLDTHDENYEKTKEGEKLPIRHCIKNTDGWKVNDKCNFLSSAKMVFEKDTFPSYKLASYLKDHPYDDVLLCGLVSNICVISNAIMVKSVLANANIYVDASLTSSTDLVLQEKGFDVLEGLHIDVINRQ